MSEPVGIVVVSHSMDIARGITQMVRQAVSNSVSICACGGNPDGGLGTDVAAIKTCLDNVWNESGVVILVDLGSSEMNSEIAIEMLEEAKRDRVIICNAPIVEGAVMAATEASIGKSLREVQKAAESVL